MDEQFETERDTLVRTWVRYQQNGDRADFWAADRVTMLTTAPGAPTDAWKVVLDLFGAVPDDVLGAFAAGPLENVVCCHAGHVIDEVERFARRDRRFRRALGRIWLTTGALAPDLETRVVAASGGAIRPLSPPAADRPRRR
jgi:hypothetical protein